jgi:hypothetical protein
MTEETTPLVTPPLLPPVEPVVEEYTRLRWGAIFGGAIAALGVWALLYAFGLAVGLSAIDPQDPNLQSLGVFGGIWSLFIPIVALFVGGLIAARGASTITRGSGVMHAVVTWGLTTIVGAWAMANVLAALVGGAVSVGQGAVSMGRSVVGSVAQQIPGVAESFGVNMDDAVAAINQRLAAEGRPEITAAGLQAAVKDVIDRGVREGRLDQQALVTALSDNTALDRQDAQAVAADISRQFAGWQSSAGRMMQDVERTALEAVEATGQAFWGVFGALLLGLLGALAGGLTGASGKVQDWAAKSRSKAYSRFFQQPSPTT